MRYTLPLLLLILITTLRISAQSGERNQPSAVIQVKGKQVHVTYHSVTSAAQELVVRLADSTGRTIFLENKPYFTGTYSRVLLLYAAPKGYYNIYFLQNGHKLTETIIIE